ncbi:MAG TPA: nuclear transport factor 2 family protein [Solirubrobacterales bacterium]
MKTLRDGYAALNRGEWDRSGEFLHPEVSWHFIEGQGPDAPRTLSGPSEIVEFWSTFFAAWEAWEMAPEAIVEAPNGKILVSLHFRARGAGSGFPMELDYWQVIDMREGKVYRVDNYLSRERAQDACGLGD